MSIHRFFFAISCKSEAAESFLSGGGSNKFQQNVILSIGLLRNSGFDRLNSPKTRGEQNVERRINYVSMHIVLANSEPILSLFSKSMDVLLYENSGGVFRGPRTPPGSPPLIVVPSATKINSMMVGGN